MADNTYYRLVVNPQPGVKKENIDYYMGKDTIQENEIIREYYPDRIITKSINYTAPDVPFLLYDLTEEEYNQVRKNPDVLSVEEPPPNITFEPFLLATQTSNFTTNPRWNYSGDFSSSIFDDTCPAINWGLQWHTAKTNIDWLKTKSLTSSYTPQSYTFYNEDFTYTLDGTGVDLIIMDSGIDYNHPEFLDKNGNTRVVLYDWSEVIGDLLLASHGNSSLPPRYYDTSIVYPHGTMVASVAAGRLNGWAKGATIYDLKTGPYSSDDGFYNKGISPAEGFVAIKRFHQNKSIDPITKVKRPTIVNMSFGHFNPILNKNPLTGYTPGVKDFMYKGTVSLSSSLGWSGDDNIPSIDYQIRLKTSQSDSYAIGIEAPTSCYFEQEYDLFKNLVSGCLAEGVIMIAAAGNTCEIISRENESRIYDSYVVPMPGTDLGVYLGLRGREKWKYSNRAGSPKENPGVISVGSLSPHLIFPKTPISGTIPFNIFGPVKQWYYTDNFDIPIPSYDHGDVINWTLPQNDPQSKLGYGVGDPFLGWEEAYNSASLVISGFSVIGPAVEIFAAGENIPIALPANVYPGGPYNSVYNNTNPRFYSIYDSSYTGTSWRMGITNGTSFSSPQVAGVACLYFQMNPAATVDDFRNFLEHYAPKDPRLRVFDDDALNKGTDFTGSFYINQPYNAMRSISLFGSSNKILHWPFTKVNPLTIT